MYYQNAKAYSEGNHRRWDEDSLKKESYQKLKEYKEEFNRLFSSEKT